MRIKRLSLARALLMLPLIAYGAPVLAHGPAKIESEIKKVEDGLRLGARANGEVEPIFQLTPRMEYYHTPGVSIAVIDGYKIIWAKAYGRISPNSDTPVTTKTLFQAASISKPVTALAALSLVEKGTLNLDEPVNARLTSWHVPSSEIADGNAVTLRRLLSHSSGLSAQGFLGYSAGSKLPSVVEILDGKGQVNSEPVRIVQQPGSGFRYSGGGYTVVQQLLEDVSGKPFNALLDKLVLGRIGMKNSNFEQPLTAGEAAHAAIGHDKDGKAIEGGWHSYPEKAAAGLWTTPTDLARFAISVARASQGKASPVPTEAAKLLLEAQKGVTLGRNNMGLGMALRPVGNGAAFWHSGGNEGYRAYLVMFPETGQGAVIMTNGDRGDELYKEVVRAIASEYHWPDTFQKQFDARAMGAEKLQEYAGSYRIGPNNGPSLVFNIEDGQLRAQGPGGQKFNLRAAGDDHFISSNDGTEIKFERNAQHGIARVRVQSDSVIITAEK